MSAAGNPLQPALDAIAARLAADAQRIAELEAELAALKGRRCPDCVHFKALPQPIGPTEYECDDELSTVLAPTFSFACNRWVNGRVATATGVGEAWAERGTG